MEGGCECILLMMTHSVQKTNSEEKRPRLKGLDLRVTWKYLENVGTRQDHLKTEGSSHKHAQFVIKQVGNNCV